MIGWKRIKSGKDATSKIKCQILCDHINLYKRNGQVVFFYFIPPIEVYRNRKKKTSIYVALLQGASVHKLESWRSDEHTPDFTGELLFIFFVFFCSSPYFQSWLSSLKDPNEKYVDNTHHK